MEGEGSGRPCADAVGVKCNEEPLGAEDALPLAASILAKFNSLAGLADGMFGAERPRIVQDRARTPSLVSQGRATDVCHHTGYFDSLLRHDQPESLDCLLVYLANTDK